MHEPTATVPKQLPTIELTDVRPSAEGITPCQAAAFTLLYLVREQIPIAQFQLRAGAVHTRFFEDGLWFRGPEMPALLTDIWLEGMLALIGVKALESLPAAGLCFNFAAPRKRFTGRFWADAARGEPNPTLRIQICNLVDR